MRNTDKNRPLIPASFAFGIIFFFFTFCDFKCGEQKIGSVKGIDFVKGKELRTPEIFRDTEEPTKEIPPNMWAILAFGSAAIGLGVYLIKDKNEVRIGMIAGIVGFCSLLGLQYMLNELVEEKGKGRIDAEFQFGYWGALAALGVASLLSYLRMENADNEVVIIPTWKFKEDKDEDNIEAETSEEVNADISDPSNPEDSELQESNTQSRRGGDNILIKLVVLAIVIYFVVCYFL